MRIKYILLNVASLTFFGYSNAFGALHNEPAGVVIQSVDAFKVSAPVDDFDAQKANFNNQELDMFFTNLDHESQAKTPAALHNFYIDYITADLLLTSLIKHPAEKPNLGFLAKKAAQLKGGVAGFAGVIYVDAKTQKALSNKLSLLISRFSKMDGRMDFVKHATDLWKKGWSGQEGADGIIARTGGTNKDLFNLYVALNAKLKAEAVAAAQAASFKSPQKPLVAPQKPATPVTPATPPAPPVTPLNEQDQKKLDGQKKTLTALRGKVAGAADSDAKTELLKEIDTQLAVTKPISNKLFSTFATKIGNFLKLKVRKASEDVRVSALAILKQQQKDLQDYHTKVNAVTISALQANKASLLKKIDEFIAANRQIRAPDFLALKKQVEAFEKRADALTAQQATLHTLQQKIADESVLATVASKDTDFGAKKTALEEKLNKNLASATILSIQAMKKLDTDVIELIAEGKQLKVQQMKQLAEAAKPARPVPQTPKPKPATQPESKPEPKKQAPTPPAKQKPSEPAPAPLDPIEAQRLLNALAESLAQLA